MVEKTFAEVRVGDKFNLNGTEYVKIENVRVSCCQSINAYLVDNNTARIFVQDNTVVSVNA